MADKLQFLPRDGMEVNLQLYCVIQLELQIK